MDKKMSKILSQRLGDSKRNAAKKGIEHNIDHDYLKHIYRISGGVCPLTKVNFIHKSNHADNLSLDRVDNSKGYIKGNVWFITTWANRSKSDLTLEQFQNRCKLIMEA